MDMVAAPLYAFRNDEYCDNNNNDRKKEYLKTNAICLSLSLHFVQCNYNVSVMRATTKNSHEY